MMQFRQNWFKGISLGVALFTLGATHAHATCGDVDGDGSIQVNDAVIAVRASAGLVSLDSNGQARADVGNSVSNPDNSLQVNDAVLIVRASAGLETLNCNETITAGQLVSVPIRYASGAPASYKGFQATINVTGATLQTTTSANLQSANGKNWNTCAMNATTKKVLCVDTAEKVASGSNYPLTYVQVQAPQTGSFTVEIADALQVDTTSGSTTAATGLQLTLTYTIGSPPPN